MSVAQALLDDASDGRHLTDADVAALADALAPRIAALLAEPAPGAAEPLVWTTARVAAHLDRSEEWVRDHRHELGLLPAAGERPRLLFDPDRVRAWATTTSTPAPAPPTQLDARRRRRASVGPNLLPIGRKAA